MLSSDLMKAILDDGYIPFDKQPIISVMLHDLLLIKDAYRLSKETEIYKFDLCGLSGMFFKEFKMLSREPHKPIAELSFYYDCVTNGTIPRRTDYDPEYSAVPLLTNR